MCGLPHLMRSPLRRENACRRACAVVDRYEVSGMTLPIVRGLLVHDLGCDGGGGRACGFSHREPAKTAGTRGRCTTCSSWEVRGGSSRDRVDAAGATGADEYRNSKKSERDERDQGVLAHLAPPWKSRKPVGLQADALMRAGRLVHATRDTGPEGLAGSGRSNVPTRCGRLSPCLLGCRDSFSLRVQSAVRDGRRRESQRLGAQAPRYRGAPAWLPKPYPRPAVDTTGLVGTVRR